MASSKPEQVLDAIKVLLNTVPNAKVERNTAVPEKIPTGGLIVLRDGDPGEPETALGGFGGVYYSHDIEIELYAEDGDATARDTAFDILVQAIGTALEADPTLGGLAFGMTYGRPEVDTEAVTGAPAIKTGMIIVTVEYETDSLLG
ncbi:MAG: acyl-CoA transferase [Rhodospirillaceae bacterium]|nr:acyl-CoA transferase [Rhodospirillaceae bacterium]